MSHRSFARAAGADPQSFGVFRSEAENCSKQPRLVAPGYCPELNPDELLNQDVKTNALGKGRPTNKVEMIATVRSHLHRRQKQPRVIRDLFLEKHLRYAS